MRKLLAGTIVICFCSLVLSEGLYTLTVSVAGAENDDGQLIASLFDSEEKYLFEPVTVLYSPISQGRSQVEFSSLSAGTYAVTVVHDENGDDEMNTNFLRIPVEPVGFSNDAKSTFGPPKFDKVAIELDESKNISIDLMNAQE